MFVGQTSAQIPETCVQDSRCSSSYNRWKMTQPHPTQYNQTVTRSLCYSYGSSCCSSTSSYSIKVKLCYGDFYVYKLQTLPGCNIAYCAVPKHSFRAAGQDETSITLRWNKVNNSVSFVLLFNGTETNISAPAADDSVTYTVSSLTAATKYTFTLFSVFDNVRSSGINIDAVTAPQNPQNIRQSTQNESSITLQWNKVNNVSFVLQLDGTETSITATDGDGPVTYTFSSLTAQTKYTVILFSVLENVRSSGQKLTVVTAPQNAKNCKASGQNETSITLQWDKVNTNVSFVLQFNGTETNISAPAGDAVIHHTVSSLTAGTKYTFTLFSVFENVRSTGVNITAATAKGPNYVVGLDMELESVGEMTEAEMQSVIEEFLQTYGLSPNSLSVKVKSVQP
ncbi:receptor-type tyrosine-protein phosphatase H-like [Oryzias latipes]